MTSKCLVKPGTKYVVSHTSSSRKNEAIQTQVITIPPRPGRVRNEFLRHRNRKITSQRDYVAETTTPNEQIYVFGERRLTNPARKWRTPSLQERKEEKQSKSKTEDSAQTQTARGVFMFGSTAQR